MVQKNKLVMFLSGPTQRRHRLITAHACPRADDDERAASPEKVR